VSWLDWLLLALFMTPTIGFVVGCVVLALGPVFAYIPSK
jgi:hypothetical protein